MNVRPIRTEADYEAALARIDALFGANPDTPEGEELDVLLVLVEHYEAQHHAMPQASPIDIIRWYMDDRGLTQADLAKLVGSRSRASEILAGKRALTLPMIRALHGQWRIPPQLLLAENGPVPEDGADIAWADYPLKELAKRGLAAGYNPKTQQEEIVRHVHQLAQLPLTAHPLACYRQGVRRIGKDDCYALHSWVLCARIHALSAPVAGNFSHHLFSHESLRTLARLSVFPDGPLKAREYLAQKGIRLIVETHLPKTYLDGAVFWLRPAEPVIALTLRHDRLDNFWFTLLHEASHLVLGHLDVAETGCIIDNLDLASVDAKELTADALALETAIPKAVWDASPVKNASRKAVAELAARLEIHPAIVAGRIRYEKRNYKLLAREVGFGEVRRLFS